MSHSLITTSIFILLILVIKVFIIISERQCEGVIVDTAGIIIYSRFLFVDSLWRNEQGDAHLLKLIFQIWFL